MRILLIDDAIGNQLSAKQILDGHDLVIVGAYDDAIKLLRRYRPKSEDQIVHERRSALPGYWDSADRIPMSEEESATWHQETEACIAKEMRINEELANPLSFDVVLCDLLLPASKETMGKKGMKFVGQEMPLGHPLALEAVKYGAKYVAVVTDSDHHDHPMSAAMDYIVADSSSTPYYFNINGTRIGYYNAWRSVVLEGTTCPHCVDAGVKDACECTQRMGNGQPEQECWFCHGSGHYCETCQGSATDRGKNWGLVLKHLIAGVD